MVLVTLGTPGNASPVLALAIGITVGFVAAGFFLLSLPFIAGPVAEHDSLRLRRLLEVTEHTGPIAWFDLLVLWSTGFIAVMGFTDGFPLYRSIFVLAAIVGLIAALRNLFLLEKPDDAQAAWQHQPQ